MQDILKVRIRTIKKKE